MAETPITNDAQVDAQIYVDFGKSITSAVAFEEEVADLNAALSVLRGQLNGLPAGLAGSIDASLKQLSKKQTAPIIDATEVNAKLQLALKQQVDRMLAGLDFKKTDFGTLDALTSEIRKEINTDLTAVMMKVKDKVKNINVSIKQIDGIMGTFTKEIQAQVAAMEAAAVTHGVPVTPTTKKGRKAAAATVASTESAISGVEDAAMATRAAAERLNRDLAEDMRRAGMAVDGVDFSEVTRSVLMLTASLDKYFTKLGTVSANIDEIVRAATASMGDIKAITLPAADIHAKLGKAVQDVINTVAIDIDGLGKISVDGGHIRRQMDAELARVTGALGTTTHPDFIGPPVAALGTVDIGAELYAKINTAVQAAIQNIGVDMTALKLDKITELILERVRDSIWSDVRNSSMPDMGDDIRFAMQRVAFAITDKVQKEMSEAVAQAGGNLEGMGEDIDRAILSLRANLTAMIEGAVHADGVARAMAGSIASNLKNVKVRGGASHIEINEATMAGIMAKVNAELNRAMVDLPVVVDRMAFSPQGVDRSAMTETVGRMRVLDQLLLERREAIDTYVHQRMLAEDAQRESMIGSIEAMVRANGGIAPHRNGYMAEEYSRLPQRFRRRNGVAPDVMAEMVNSTFGTTYDGDELITYLAARPPANRTSRREIRAQAERYAEGIQDIDRAINQIEGELLQALERHVTPAELNRLRNMNPADKMAAIGRALNQVSKNIDGVLDGQIAMLREMTAQYDTRGLKPLNVGAYQRAVVNELNGLSKKLVNVAIEQLAMADAAEGGQVVAAVTYAVDRFAKAYANAIRKAVKTNVVAEAMAMQIEARVAASMESIAASGGKGMPQLNRAVKASMKVIMDVVEAQIATAITTTNIPIPKKIKIDRAGIKRIMDELQVAINTAIAEVQVPQVHQAIKINDGQIMGVLNAVETMIHSYIDNIGRALAMTPAMTVPTNKLSRRIQESIQRTQGALPDQIASRDVIGHLMQSDSQAIESAYSRHLRQNLQGYRRQVMQDLETIPIEPNQELSQYFIGEMYDLQNKIYRRIRQVIQAQMAAFSTAVNEAIVEPIRTLPSVSNRLNMYNQLASPVVNTNRALTQQANDAVRTAQRSQHGLNRALFGTGMHILAGSFYAMPFYMAYKAKEAIIDLSAQEAKIKQNMMASPETQNADGSVNVTAARGMYQQQFEPYIWKTALRYGIKSEDAFNAATIVTRRNRPLEEQKEFLQSIMRLHRIDEVGIEDAANVEEAVMSQFNVSARQLPRLERAIAAATAMTQATGTDIGETLKRAGVTASNVGLGVEDTVALSAIMGQFTGQKGDVIGTFLKTALDRVGKAKIEPFLNTTLDKAYKQGMIGEKMTVYDENGKITPILKLFTTLADISNKVSDKERIQIYRTIFGEWQKNRGTSFMQAIAENGVEPASEASYYKTIDDYMLKFSEYADKLKSFTQADTDKMLAEGMDKAEVYINQVVTAYQKLTRALASDDAVQNLKDFSNALTNLMLKASENPSGLGNTIGQVLRLIEGLVLMKGWNSWVVGENGMWTRARNTYQAGVDDYYSRRATATVADSSPLIMQDVVRNRRDFRDMVYGQTFPFRQSTAENRLAQAVGRYEQFASGYDRDTGGRQRGYNEVLQRLQRGGRSAADAEAMLGRMVQNRIRRGDSVQLPSGSTRSLYRLGQVDLTWMERMRQLNPNVQGVFRDMTTGLRGVSTNVQSLNRNVGVASTAFGRMGSRVRGVATTGVAGFGAIAKSLGGVVKQIGIALLAAEALNKVFGNMQFNQLSGSQKIDSTQAAFDSAINADVTEKAKLVAELKKAGLNTDKFSGLSYGQLKHDLLNLGDERRKIQSGKSKLSAADQAAVMELNKLDSGTFMRLGLPRMLSPIGDKWDSFSKAVDWTALDKAGIKKHGDWSGTVSYYLQHPDQVPGFAAWRRQNMETQLTQQIRTGEAEKNGWNSNKIKQVVAQRLPAALKKAPTYEEVALALHNAVGENMTTQSMSQKELEDAGLKKATDQWNKQAQDNLDSMPGVSLGLDDAAKAKKSTFLENLRRQMSEAEDQTSMKQLMLKYKGFGEDTTFFRQSMMAQKNNELSTIQSQITKLKNYSPADADEKVEVQERIAELNKRMWETLVDIKELQENNGTFNLPDGIKVMSQYDYLKQRNTLTSQAMSLGGVHYEVSIGNINGNNPDEIKQAANQGVAAAVKAATRNVYEKQMANNLTRALARGV